MQRFITDDVIFFIMNIFLGIGVENRQKNEFDSSNVNGSNSDSNNLQCVQAGRYMDSDYSEESAEE